MAERAGANWPAAQATVNFIEGFHDPPDPPGYGPAFHIKLISIKNIDICPICESKSIIFGAHAQIWAYIILLIIVGRKGEL